MASLKQREGRRAALGDGQPIELQDKWLSVWAAIADDRLSGGDLRALIVILDRFGTDTHHSRTSFTDIVRETGLNRRTAIRACDNLVSLGYVAVKRLGAGTRGTEYLPNWSIGNSSGDMSATTSNAGVGGDSLTTTQVVAESPLGPTEVTSAPPDSHSSSQSLDVTRGNGVKVTHGVATPPPDAASGAGQAEPPRDPCEELFDTYGHRHELAKARAAYLKLAPSPELHSDMLDAAERWRTAYDAEGREPKWRTLLHNWIANQCYLEDGPLPYVGKATAATKLAPRTPAAAPVAAAEPQASWRPARPVTAATYAGEQHLRVIGGSEVDRRGPEWRLTLEFEVLDGPHRGDVFSETLTVQSGDSRAQDVGQAQIGEICKALGEGIGSVAAVEQFVGAEVVATIPRDVRKFEPYWRWLEDREYEAELAANDNGQPQAERRPPEAA